MAGFRLCDDVYEDGEHLQAFSSVFEYSPGKSMHKNSALFLNALRLTEPEVAVHQSFDRGFKLVKEAKINISNHQIEHTSTFIRRQF